METSPKPKTGWRRLFASPWMHIAAGLLMTVTAGIEIIENMDILFQEQSNIGGHHGMFFYGLVTLFNKVAELLEGTIAVEKHTVSRENG